MNKDKNNIKENEINNKTNKIYETINIIDKKLDEINKKINEINDIYIQYEFNRNLKLGLTTSYLKFQIEVLFNERKYYLKIKNIIIKKFIKELYNISEFVILILISLEDLDIGLENDKRNIMKKILKMKRMKNLNVAKINELISIILNNLRLNRDFLNLFENFILEKEQTNNRKNIHSKNLVVNLMSKKNHLQLEYEKNVNQLSELVDYFYDFSICIDKQLKKQELLHFTLK